MTAPQRSLHSNRDVTGDSPVAMLVGIGAALGLLFALLIAVDWPLGMAAGATIGVIVGLVIDTWRTPS